MHGINFTGAVRVSALAGPTGPAINDMIVMGAELPASFQTRIRLHASVEAFLECELMNN